MALTKRFGMERFGGSVPGSIQDAGGQFTLYDRDVIDAVLAAMETHTHAGGARLGDPSGIPTATLGTGGSLPGGTTFFYRVALLDLHGLETMAGPEVSLATPAQVQPPSVPAITGVSGGSLASGLYYWGGTSVDASGVETPLGSPMLYTVSTPNFTANIAFPALPTGAASINVWRQGPSDSGYTKIGSITGGGTTFVDNGSVPSDPSAGFDPAHQPPATNNTGSTSTITVKLADVDANIVTGGQVKSWRLYRSTSSGDYGYQALVHEVVETSSGTILLTSWIDDGTATLGDGEPQVLSRTLTPSLLPAGQSLSVANRHWARNVEAMFVGNITRDSNGAATSAPVIWPDGYTGTYTGKPSVISLGAVDSYAVTYVVGATTTTYTQPAVTRDSSGRVTTRPDLTVA